MPIKFGVAGFPPNFHKSEFKKNRDNVFAWLKELGLDWIELQNTYGVKMPDDQAKRYRMLAEQYGIGISIHAPYYISFGSKNPEVVERSKERMIQCFQLAQKLGSERIIFHPGYPPGKAIEDRRKGIDQIVTALKEIQPLRPAGVYVYPETAGKRNQIGSVSEIIDICRAVDYARPCLDLAHVHGFEGGSLNSAKAIWRVINSVEQEFGDEFLNYAHFHMYPVEYDRHGEKKHKAFDDSDTNSEDRLYHPTAEDFVQVAATANLNAVVICEARDTQDTGALLMKKLLDKV